jgi:GNAT superfamily N-acetyltransferase
MDPGSAPHHSASAYALCASADSKRAVARAASVGGSADLKAAVAREASEGGALHAAVHPGAHIIRPAVSDEDALLIFRFLCEVATPVLHCAINKEKSFAEVRRVVAERDYGFAYMALEGGRLVGTLGAIFVSWWYGDDSFFTDRWFFSLPGHRWAGPRLLAEADAIARAVGVPLIVNLKQRRTTAAVTFVKPELLGEHRRVG